MDQGRKTERRFHPSRPICPDASNSLQAARRRHPLGRPGDGADHARRDPGALGREPPVSITSPSRPMTRGRSASSGTACGSATCPTRRSTTASAGRSTSTIPTATGSRSTPTGGRPRAGNGGADAPRRSTTSESPRRSIETRLGDPTDPASATVRSRPRGEVWYWRRPADQARAHSGRKDPRGGTVPPVRTCSRVGSEVRDET